jgi:hypothetical protein
MDSCCDTSCTRGQSLDTCRRCGDRGQKVERQTIESFLSAEARLRLKSGDYFFDNSPDCDVVYFSNKLDSYFTKRDVRVRVGIKESEPPILICYCFGHTVESAQAEIQTTGRSTVATEITKEIQAGHCACEVKNPSGRCCLGEVNKTVRKLFAESEMANPPTQA